MPIITPGRRWQPAYYPFRKTTISEKILTWIERSVKGPLWGCRMCGNCTLQETGFICAMACPKGIKNGPCGGSMPERCYVDTSRPCIWYAIYDQSFKDANGFIIGDSYEKISTILNNFGNGNAIYDDKKNIIYIFNQDNVVEEIVYGTLSK